MDAIFNMLKDMDESFKKLHKAYQELETLDKMKDEFIFNVAVYYVIEIHLLQPARSFEYAHEANPYLESFSICYSVCELFHSQDWVQRQYLFYPWLSIG
jgi:hypothetical protein